MINVHILCCAGHTYLSADWTAKNRAKFYIENEAKVCSALLCCLITMCCNILSFIVVIFANIPLSNTSTTATSSSTCTTANAINLLPTPPLHLYSVQ